MEINTKQVGNWIQKFNQHDVFEEILITRYYHIGAACDNHMTIIQDAAPKLPTNVKYPGH